MTSEAQEDPLAFVGTSDLAGIVRGKSFPSSEWEKRCVSGVGWTPTNVQITCFDSISDSPFGSLGDLALIPDPQTRINIKGTAQALDFSLGDIRSLEGEPWAFCTRSLAKRALHEFHELTQASVLSAFEHEFQIKDLPPRTGDAYGFRGFRDAHKWVEPLMAALRQTPCTPDTFMKEFGPSQYELTNKPGKGLAAADNAVILRMLTDDVIRSCGYAPSFSPILDPDSVGNGVHIHLSFHNDDGKPLTYDGNNPHGMSSLTRQFIGGILKYLDSIIAILAPSEISYLRLTPHRWSAAFNNIGYRDREACVRICPTSAVNEQAVARQFNFEVRCVDSAASPHLALAALLFAGAQGIKDGLDPPLPTEEDLSVLSPKALAAKGLKRLPTSLGEALDLFSASDTVRSWFSDDFVDVYTAHKRGEITCLNGLDWQEKCDRYKDVY